MPHGSTADYTVQIWRLVPMRILKVRKMVPEPDQPTPGSLPNIIPYSSSRTNTEDIKNVKFLHAYVQLTE